MDDEQPIKSAVKSPRPKTRVKEVKTRAKEAAPAEPPAAGRSLWSGQLRLALVSIPVQLFSA
jgi:hypothetical protein